MGEVEWCRKEPSPGDRAARRLREAKTGIFTDGAEAYRRGQPQKDNPYLGGDNRYLWFQGFYGERLLSKFGIPYSVG